MDETDLQKLSLLVWNKMGYWEESCIDRCVWHSRETTTQMLHECGRSSSHRAVSSKQVSFEGHIQHHFSVWAAMAVCMITSRMLH